jgi:radical SAM superfamily enzyme YgiQ (UPF0313 family)
MRVLLVSTYELGHQPLHVASPAAALEASGHEVVCLDTSVEPWRAEVVDTVDAVAFSVPMHTAMRLALRAARAARERRPDVPICLYGLYAPVSHDLTLGSVADRVIGGEYEPALVAWVDGLARPEVVSTPSHAGLVRLERSPFGLPRRAGLPPLDRYARLEHDGRADLVGYVEASHGCAHECRHCPVPAVYGGRIRLVPRSVVLADVDQLVAAGARHITFGDPDFLNGWRHSLAIVRELSRRHPAVTFDCTTKVEHILEHEHRWGELAAAGCLFVVCALECVNDDILVRLDKGHTTEQARRAIAVLRRHGIEMRPSFLPFTPWSRARDVLDILDFVVEHDMVANVDPVQYSIRLLLPEGSLLLRHPDLQPHLGPYDPELLTYTWTAADPAVDDLQSDIAALVSDADRPAGATFGDVYRLVARAAGVDGDPVPVADGVSDRPRLTEAWFCCAEPTESQLSSL